MKHNHSPFHQHGAVLIVSLLFLLVMLLIGVAAMQTNLLEERMAGNFRDQDLAFQAAEMTLRDAETFVLGDLQGFKTDCSDGLCIPSSDLDNPVWETIDWKSTADTKPFREYGNQDQAEMPFVASDPRYIVEEIPVEVSTPGNSMVSGFTANPSDEEYYRITARAVGASGNSVVMLQSVYRK